MFIGWGLGYLRGSFVNYLYSQTTWILCSAQGLTESKHSVKVRGRAGGLSEWLSGSRGRSDSLSKYLLDIVASVPGTTVNKIRRSPSLNRENEIWANSKCRLQHINPKWSVDRRWKGRWTGWHTNGGFKNQGTSVWDNDKWMLFGHDMIERRT